MDIVIVGHVDHGKSTVVGRLLADTRSLPEGKLEQVKANCERNSKPFEYAFLLDALKDEQSQGITIDAARIFFKTALRAYTIIDAPGHIEFLKNMVTGASRAECALLVIDSKEGVRENSRRHGYMLSMLGIRQVAVLINKMDLLNYDETGFEKVKSEYARFLKEINVTPLNFIPVAGFHGENIAQKSSKMPWYKGKTVIETLDSFQSELPPSEKSFRMPVQDVYKFTRGGDDRRIVVGTIESGTLQVGSEVVFYPSGKKSKVNSIEAFNHPALTLVGAREAAAFTLTEQIYISRGEIATIVGQQKVHVATRIRVSLFWLGKEPMVRKKAYLLKLGTAKVEARLEEVLRVMDTSNLSVVEKGELIPTNSVAECILRLDQAVAVDLASDFSGTGRLVIVDRYDISGGGLVKEALEDSASWIRDKVILRNSKWELSMIPVEARAERYSQRASLILISSSRDLDRKTIAKKLESNLFESGRIVYYLGIGNALYGVSADIRGNENSFDEALRRFSEVVNVLLDAGILVIATIAELTQENLEIIRASIEREKIETIWIGSSVTTNLVSDFKTGTEVETEVLTKIKSRLQDTGLIFKSW